jgi:uncharacterized membrane protein YfcA
LIPLSVTELFSTLLAWLAGATPTGTLLTLAGIAMLAGYSRGLTGFGAGMIFVPLASGSVGPINAIGMIWIIDTPTMIAVAPGALRRGDWKQTGYLLAGWAISTPGALLLLRWLDPLTVRWIISAMILCAVTLLVGGWTYRGKPTPRLAFATGIASGIAGGLTGLSGPPIVMLWLAAAAASAMNVRDNLNLFFVLTTAVYMVLFPLYGILTWAVVRLGLLLAIPYGAGVIAGTLTFRTLGDRNYRRAAYIVIGIAALLALPWMDTVLGRK